MKTLFLTLLLATLCATGYGQTLKSVMIDTNGVQVNQFGNGSATNAAIKIGGATNWGFRAQTGPNTIGVVLAGTNVASFLSTGIQANQFSGNFVVGSGQSLSFSGGAQVAESRTNLGLGWPALTNTNAATSLLGINASNQVVAATNIIFTNGVAFTTNAAAATLANLGLGTNASVTISNLNVQSVSITNTGAFRTNIGAQETLISATNIKTINGQPILGAGDLVISGGTNTNSFNQSLNTTDDVTFNALNVSNKALTRTNLGLGTTNQVQFATLFASNISANLVEVAQTLFIGDGAGLLFDGEGAGNFRTNLGLGATWLTNGNITNFRAAVLPSYSNNASKILGLNTNGTDVEWLTASNIVAAGGGGSVAYPIDITNGGTGATNSAGARDNLGLGTNSAVTFSNMTLQNLVNSGSPNERGFLVRNSSGQINFKGDGVTTGHPALYGWNGTVNTNFNGNASAPTNTNTPAAWIAVEEGTNAYRIPLYR